MAKIGNWEKKFVPFQPQGLRSAPRMWFEELGAETSPLALAAMVWRSPLTKAGHVLDEEAAALLPDNFSSGWLLPIKSSVSKQR